jgi:thermitase
LIVRDTLGLSHLNLQCLLLGCKVQYGLGDPSNQLFLVTTSLLNPIAGLLKGLNLNLGIIDIELDQQISAAHPASVAGVPSALYASTPINYYGSSVRYGYVNQPATQLIQLARTQSTYKVTGAGTVAIIDTGVDTTQPVLQAVLVPGYDFVHNRAGADEKGDITQSTAAVLDQSTASVLDQSTAAVLDGSGFLLLDQSTAAVLDQSTAAVLDNSQYADFGHGTMVAGVVHLVAPTAKIMPLKAFGPDGTGYVSDVVRALYYAQKNGAKVVNMSFDFTSPSAELSTAVNYVAGKNVILVAAAGNDGKNVLVYPAAYSNVIGVASTNDSNYRSAFSNYGTGSVWVAAPGEGVVTTYPYGHYAAVSGTSFSAPLAAGTAALLVQVSQTANQNAAATSLSHADWISTDLNYGLLDTYTAVSSWRSALGIR